MPRSPKRNGILVESWPLSNSPLQLEPPQLTLSPSSSTESLMPPTPTTESFLLPGFHFSTTDANVDPAEFHRVAAQLLSGESTKRDSAVAGDNWAAHERQLHCDLGKDPSGRYCCSCGKSYSTPFRLREHTQSCAGTNQHPCSTCDKMFETKEKLDRHVASRHNDNKEACPECGELFPASDLPKHLASGLGGCDGMIQASMGPAPEIDRAYRQSSMQSPSQHFWIYDGDLSWSQSKKQPRDSKMENDNDQVVEQTMTYVKKLLRRPTSHQNHEPCDLCGEVFNDRDALAVHIGEHSVSFAEKSHRCDDCRIYFANEKDLDRHLQSANLNSHCGFTFKHSGGSCTGHHPPNYFKSSLGNDHNLMQKHLWAWELSQLRTHRLAVARLLAERLTSSVSKHMTVQDCKRTYVSLLPHVSVASSRDSTQIESGWIKDRRESETTQLDSHFSRIMSETFPEEDEEILQRIKDADNALDIRPDSTVIPIPREPTNARDPKRASKRKSFIDLTKRRTAAVEAVKSGHKRNHSGPISFLRHQASREATRPQSLPSHVVQSMPVVRSAA